MYKLYNYNIYSCFEYVPQTDSSHLLYPGNSSAAPLLKVAYSGCINNICSVHDVAEYKFRSCVSFTTKHCVGISSLIFTSAAAAATTTTTTTTTATTTTSTQY